jgi:hypothetical protein
MYPSAQRKKIATHLKVDFLREAEVCYFDLGVLIYEAVASGQIWKTKITAGSAQAQ